MKTGELLPTVVAIILGIAAMILMYFIAILPGSIAKKNNHPYASAIKALGIIGFLFLGLGWLAALIWAHLLPEEHYNKLKETQQEPKESKTIREYKEWKKTQK